MNPANMLWLVVLAALEGCWRTSASEIPKEVLADVEANLLSLFGFKGRPNVDKTKLVIPEAMLQLYEKQMGFPLETTSIPKRGWNTKSANTVRSFTHIETPIDMRFRGQHKFRLKFDTEAVPKNEKLKAAELTLSRIKLQYSPQDLEDTFFQRVLVKDILQPGIKGRHEAITRVVDSKVVDTRSNSTLSLDVLPAVQRWFHDPKSNHGLLVVVSGMGKNKSPPHHVRLRRSLPNEENNSADPDWHQTQPLLLTYTDDGSNKQRHGTELTQMRKRRATKHRQGGRRENPCSRQKMYVSFEDVGWSDWIVAPPGYDAYHCKGDCNFPLAAHLNTTNHAIVQTLMNSVYPAKIPKTCCVPTALNSISMLYVDDESKVVLKNYKEMVVVGCGCR